MESGPFIGDVPPQKKLHKTGDLPLSHVWWHHRVSRIISKFWKRDSYVNHRWNTWSIDWFKGQITGKSHDLRKIYGFRLRFSLGSQPIDMGNGCSFSSLHKSTNLPRPTGVPPGTNSCLKRSQPDDPNWGPSNYGLLWVNGLSSGKIFTGNHRFSEDHGILL